MHFLVVTTILFDHKDFITKSSVSLYHKCLLLVRRIQVITIRMVSLSSLQDHSHPVAHGLYTHIPRVSSLKISFYPVTLFQLSCYSPPGQLLLLVLQSTLQNRVVYYLLGFLMFHSMGTTNLLWLFSGIHSSSWMLIPCLLFTP